MQNMGQYVPVNEKEWDSPGHNEVNHKLCIFVLIHLSEDLPLIMNHTTPLDQFNFQISIFQTFLI